MIHIDRVNNFVFPTRFPTTTLYYKKGKKKGQEESPRTSTEKETMKHLLINSTLSTLQSKRGRNPLFWE